ncbi:MAG: helix-turn-helix transcriptional regulator [Bacillota bacterium]
MNNLNNEREYIEESYFGYGSRNSSFSYDHRRSNSNRIHNKIKEMNSYSSMTQADIARLIDISPVQFNRIIKGNVSLSLDAIVKIAYLCNCSIDKIIQEEKKLGFITHLEPFIQQEVDHD